MTLLGKILCFLILIFSMVFAAFAVSTFATHRNFLVEARELQQKFQELQSNNQRLEDYVGKLEAGRSTSDAAFDAEMARLSGDAQGQQAQLRTLRDELVAKQSQLRLARDEVRTLLVNHDRAVGELANVRSGLQAASVERENNFARAVELADEVSQKGSQADRLNDETLRLTEREADLDGIIRHHGLSEAQITNEPPDVRGQILRLNADAKLVEISIGSDDGIAIGHELVVYRLDGDSRFLGTIRIVNVSPDRAVGKVISMRAAIRRDDLVGPNVR